MTGEPRDAADFKEAQCGPEPIVEPIENLIAEAAAPSRLTADAVKRLEALLRPGSAEQQAAPMLRLQELLQKFSPSRSELISRWAFNFAIRSPQVNNLAEADVAKLLGVSRESVSKQVREWRRILGIPEENFRSQSIAIGHKKRKAAGYVYLTPTTNPPAGSRKLRRVTSSPK